MEDHTGLTARYVRVMERLADALFPVHVILDLVGVGICKQITTCSVLETDFQLPAQKGLGAGLIPRILLDAQGRATL